MLIRSNPPWRRPGRWHSAAGIVVATISLSFGDGEANRRSAAGTELAQASARPNVLLVTIDTIRADRVGAYGHKPSVTPVLDRLAAESVRFADATAHVPLTLPAHVAIMTGRYPSVYGVRLNGHGGLPASAATLAQRLRAAGYSTGAVVASAILDQAYGLDRGFDHYDDDLAGKPGQTVALAELQRPARDVTALARAWLDRQASGPWFLWVHLFDPHLPYEPPAKYLAAAGGKPYEGEIAYADAELGALLTRVDRRTTVVVVTGDHGESLGDHGETDHGYFVYDATLAVPLIIRAPGVAARVVSEQVRSVDIAPTIQELVGLPVEAGIDGESLVGLMRGQAPRVVPPSYAESWYPRLHFGWSELRAVRVGEWKYVAAPRAELYDLRSDPGERRNVRETRGNVAGRLAAELGALSSRADDAAAGDRKPPPQPDAEALRRLQALGYVGGLAPSTPATLGVDPKDRLAEYERYRRQFNAALGALEGGRLDEAIAGLKSLVKLNVRAFEVHLYLGNAYALSGRRDEALGEYEAVRQLNPRLATVYFEMAKVHTAQGDVASAVKRCEEGLELEPASFYGLYTMGVVYQKAGRFADALAVFSRAVAANPREPRARTNLGVVALRTGDLDLARVQYEALLDLKYNVAPAHFNLGYIAEQKGDLAGARRQYEAALKADPAFAPAKQALARIK